MNRTRQGPVAYDSTLSLRSGVKMSTVGFLTMRENQFHGLLNSHAVAVRNSLRRRHVARDIFILDSRFFLFFFLE